MSTNVRSKRSASTATIISEFALGGFDVKTLDQFVTPAPSRMTLRGVADQLKTKGLLTQAEAFKNWSFEEFGYAPGRRAGAHVGVLPLGINQKREYTVRGAVDDNGKVKGCYIQITLTGLGYKPGDKITAETNEYGDISLPFPAELDDGATEEAAPAQVAAAAQPKTTLRAARNGSAQA